MKCMIFNSWGQPKKYFAEPDRVGMEECSLDFFFYLGQLDH